MNILNWFQLWLTKVHDENGKELEWAGIILTAISFGIVIYTLGLIINQFVVLIAWAAIVVNSVRLVIFSKMEKFQLWSYKFKNYTISMHGLRRKA